MDVPSRRLPKGYKLLWKRFASDLEKLQSVERIRCKVNERSRALSQFVSKEGIRDFVNQQTGNKEIESGDPLYKFSKSIGILPLLKDKTMEKDHKLDQLQELEKEEESDREENIGTLVNTDFKVSSSILGECKELYHSLLNEGKLNENDPILEEILSLSSEIEGKNMKKISFLGMNGVGKSLLINLLLRLTVVAPSEYRSSDMRRKRIEHMKAKGDKLEGVIDLMLQKNLSQSKLVRNYPEKLNKSPPPRMDHLIGYCESGDREKAVISSSFLLPSLNDIKVTTSFALRIKYGNTVHIAVEFHEANWARKEAFKFVEDILEGDRPTPFRREMYKALIGDPKSVKRDDAPKEASQIELLPQIKDVAGRCVIYSGNGDDWEVDRQFTCNVLKDMNTSNEWASKRYVMQSVVLYVPSFLVNSGRELIDIPGINDSDPFNAQIVFNILSETNFLFILTNGRNLSANDTIQKSFEVNLGMQDFLNNLFSSTNSSYHLSIVGNMEKDDRITPQTVMEDTTEHKSFRVKNEDLRESNKSIFTQKMEDFGYDMLSSEGKVSFHTICPVLFSSIVLNEEFQDKSPHLKELYNHTGGWELLGRLEALELNNIRSSLNKLIQVFEKYIKGEEGEPTIPDQLPSSVNFNIGQFLDEISIWRNRSSFQSTFEEDYLSELNDLISNDLDSERLFDEEIRLEGKKLEEHFAKKWSKINWKRKLQLVDQAAIKSGFLDPESYGMAGKGEESFQSLVSITQKEMITHMKSITSKLSEEISKIGTKLRENIVKVVLRDRTIPQNITHQFIQSFPAFEKRLKHLLRQHFTGDTITKKTVNDIKKNSYRELLESITIKDADGRRSVVNIHQQITSAVNSGFAKILSKQFKETISEKMATLMEAVGEELNERTNEKVPSIGQIMTFKFISNIVEFAEKERAKELIGIQAIQIPKEEVPGEELIKQSLKTFYELQNQLPPLSLTREMTIQLGQKFSNDIQKVALLYHLSSIGDGIDYSVAPMDKNGHSPMLLIQSIDDIRKIPDPINYNLPLTFNTNFKRENIFSDNGIFMALIDQMYIVTDVSASNFTFSAVELKKQLLDRTLRCQNEISRGQFFKVMGKTVEEYVKLAMKPNYFGDWYILHYFTVIFEISISLWIPGFNCPIQFVQPKVGKGFRFLNIGLSKPVNSLINLNQNNAHSYHLMEQKPLLFNPKKENKTIFVIDTNILMYPECLKHLNCILENAIIFIPKSLLEELDELKISPDESRKMKARNAFIWLTGKRPQKLEANLQFQTLSQQKKSIAGQPKPTQDQKVICSAHLLREEGNHVIVLSNDKGASCLCRQYSVPIRCLGLSEIVEVKRENIISKLEKWKHDPLSKRPRPLEHSVENNQKRIK